MQKKQKSLPSKLGRLLRPIIPDGVFANLGQWYSRSLHDPDFAVFDELFAVPGLVLDVGANRGHSALSILRHTNRVRVFSVEPNHEHRWDLLLIKLLHPFRFRFRVVAAGNTNAQKLLFIPGERASRQSAIASLDPTEFERDHVRAQLLEVGIDSNDQGSFRKIKTQVVPLDTLKLSPDLIKLDVEGFELQALQGLQETLTKYLPALLIEANHPHRWLPLILSLGYEIYYFNHTTKSLNGFENFDGILNIFCLHAKSQTKITQVLRKKINLSMLVGSEHI